MASIVTSSGLIPAWASSARSPMKFAPFSKGVPIFFPTRSAGALMPELALAITATGNFWNHAIAYTTGKPCARASSTCSPETIANGS